ncbi:serpin B4-like [Spea bombifrons]|uniref:serpin B4-like n=1 Tax=Spea bombifrons TaxID=233779 RepID=UPI002349A1EF|nr:serpin B4-like [Spea bombifrons]
MGSINESINTFSLKMYDELGSSSNARNIIFSPLSMTSSLSMLLLGTQGNTASQLTKVLGLPETGDNRQAGCKGGPKAQGVQLEQRVQRQRAPLCDQFPDVHHKFQALLSKLTSLTKDAELKIANGMYAQKQFPFLQQYLTCTQLLYHAKLESVDFQKEETREDINLWVESQTQGKIKELFPANSIDTNTSLILVNAIYFKGPWKNPFKVEDTNDAPFYVSKDVVKMVPMMTQTTKCNLGVLEELGAHILELSYGDGGLSMFILLTDEKFGLEKVEPKLSSESLALWTSSENMINTKVEIYLPRFKLEQSIDLGSHLINMGMVDAFSPEKANLSGISDVGLYVSKVVHKAFVDVNEEGTEAAAATGIVIVPKMLVFPHKFNANHPFMFFIKHNETNTFLFHGKFYSP